MSRTVLVTFLKTDIEAGDQAQLSELQSLRTPESQSMLRFKPNYAYKVHSLPMKHRLSLQTPLSMPFDH